MYSEPVRSKNDRLYIWTMSVFVGLVVIMSGYVLAREISKAPEFLNEEVVEENQNDKDIMAEVLGESENRRILTEANVKMREKTTDGNTLTVSRLSVDSYEVIDIDVSFSERLVGLKKGDYLIVTSHNEFGGLIWNTIIRSIDFQRIYSRIIKDSKLFLTGEFDEDLEIFGTERIVNTLGGTDVLFIVIDEFGNLEEFEGRGTIKDDSLGSIQIDNYGNPAVTILEE